MVLPGHWNIQLFVAQSLKLMLKVTYITTIVVPNYPLKKTNSNTILFTTCIYLQNVSTSFLLISTFNFNLIELPKIITLKMPLRLKILPHSDLLLTAQHYPIWVPSSISWTQKCKIKTPDLPVFLAPHIQQAVQS